MVEPQVQDMIHQARRDQVSFCHVEAKAKLRLRILQEQMGNSDSPESEPPSLTSSSSINLLPQPHPKIFPQGRLPSIPNSFDSGQSRGGAQGHISHMHRSSGNEQSLDRLPSITSSGMLIERDRLAALQHGTSEDSNIKLSMSPTRADHMMDAGTSVQSLTVSS